MLTTNAVRLMQCLVPGPRTEQELRVDLSRSRAGVDVALDRVDDLERRGLLERGDGAAIDLTVVGLRALRTVEREAYGDLVA